MEGSSIEEFIETLRTDDALRQRVVEAESAAARDINRGTDAITELAAKEGFDISGWPGRPITEGPAAAEESDFGCCTLTCCLVQTSVAVVQEADGPLY